MNLSLVMSQPINDVLVDGYFGDNKAYFTREQVGTALEYANPQKAIDNIHARYKDRLDPLSVTLKLRATDGKEYDTCVYCFKGVMEICRWSRQPKADLVMDALYDMAEEVLTKGYYSVLSDEALAQLLDEKLSRSVEGRNRLRESRKEKTALLDLERNSISVDEYIFQLRLIWENDSGGYHKAFDEYMKWYETVGCTLNENS